MLFSATTLSFLSLAALANAHGFVRDIKGANGVTENGFGVNAASIKPNNQGPVSVFRSANQPCGVGVEAGPINIASSIEAAISAGLPTVGANGAISMTWQQINAGKDGGGPGTAQIDTTGTGNNFKPLTITKNFADGGANSANPVTLQLAAGTVCTGGSNRSTCLVKLTNSAGPFGSCFAVASPANAANNGAQQAVAPAPASKAPAAQPAAQSTNTKKGKGRKGKKAKGSKQRSKHPRSENKVERNVSNFVRAVSDKHDCVKRIVARR